jgi:hypothetical protein
LLFFFFFFFFKKIIIIIIIIKGMVTREDPLALYLKNARENEQS